LLAKLDLVETKMSLKKACSFIVKALHSHVWIY